MLHEEIIEIRKELSASSILSKVSNIGAITPHQIESEMVDISQYYPHHPCREVHII